MPQFLHSTSAPTSSPFSASKSGLYLQPQPLNPSSASTFSLSSCIQHQPPNPASASTSNPRLYNHPQPKHPALASTTIFSLYNHPQPLHSASPSTTILSLYIKPQFLKPSSASTFNLNLYIQPQTSHTCPKLSGFLLSSYCTNERSSLPLILVHIFVFLLGISHVKIMNITFVSCWCCRSSYCCYCRGVESKGKKF